MAKKAKTTARVNKNVFINCPFDIPYQKILKPMIFSIVRHGYNPSIASDRIDSADWRLE